MVMKALAANWDMLLVFAVLALLKGATEVYAYRRQNHGGGYESSQFISSLFVVAGVATPFMILAEIVVWKHRIQPLLAISMALAYAGLLLLRVLAVRTLGEYYSVNIRIAADHELIDWGVYRYLRHPIYLVALLENLIYPLAAGAYISAIALTFLMTPAILRRRQEEETHLLATFGDAYMQYRQATWF